MSTGSDDSRTHELTPVLSPRWALGWRHFALVAFFGLVFLGLSYRPLSDARVWLAALQGRVTLDLRAVPDTDAAQPLTDGMPMIAVDWLSQVALAVAETWGGPAWISNLMSLMGLVCCVILARVFFLQTRRIALVLVGLVSTLLFVGGSPGIAGPEVFGLLCLATLLWLLSASSGAGFALPPPDAANGGPRSPRRWAIWIAAPALFVLWANLHGSFLLGLSVLACCAVGRLVEVVWNTRSLAAILSDKLVHAWVLLTELCCLATLANPYGLDLILENLRLVRNQNVLQSPQWLPLALPGWDAMLFVGSVVVLAVVLRHSRRPVRPAEALLLVCLGAAVVPTGYALPWYGAIFAFVLMPHLGDLADRALPVRVPAGQASPEQGRSARAFLVSLFCLLAIWCSFALAPISEGVLGAKQHRADRTLAVFPAAVAEQLRAQAPQQPIFAPPVWADWLAWACAPKLQVLMTSDVHRVPRRVWDDYDKIANARRGWEQALRRYAVQTVVVDKRRQPLLAAVLRSSPRWEIRFEDDAALIAGPARRQDDQGPDRAGETSQQTSQQRAAGASPHS